MVKPFEDRRALLRRTLLAWVTLGLLARSVFFLLLRLLFLRLVGRLALLVAGTSGKEAGTGGGCHDEYLLGCRG